MSSQIRAEIVDLIERKRATCSENLDTLLTNDEITEETHQRLILANEQLARILKATFVRGAPLVESGAAKSISKLLEFEKRPKSDDEAFEIMRQMVVEGSRNPIVRKFAIDLAKRGSGNRGINVEVPPIETLYSESLRDEETGIINPFIVHCAMVVNDILEYVKKKSTYVSDPPNDFYQPAISTLEILDLNGDCDDLAILLCSVLRSIGYGTFLGYQDRHVFAGVILPRLILPSEGRKNIQYVEVPVDPQLDDFELEFGSRKFAFSVFDLPTGEFLRRLESIIMEQQSTIEETEIAGEMLGKVRNRLSLVSSAKIFHIDARIPTLSIEEILKEDILRIVKGES